MIRTTEEVVVGCVCYGYEKIKIKINLLFPLKFPRVPLVIIVPPPSTAAYIDNLGKERMSVH